MAAMFEMLFVLGDHAQNIIWSWRHQKSAALYLKTVKIDDSYVDWGASSDGRALA